MSIVPLLVSETLLVMALKASCVMPVSTDAKALAVGPPLAVARAWTLMVPEFVNETVAEEAAKPEPSAFCVIPLPTSALADASPVAFANA
jgi:hypothetical protein